MKKKMLCGLVVFAVIAILINGCDKSEEKKVETPSATISDTEKAAADAAEQKRLAEEKVKADAEAAEQKRLLEEKAKAEAEAAEQERLAEEKALAEAAAAREKAAEFENEIKELGAFEADRGWALTLEEVAFDVNRADLQSDIIPAIERLANFLKKYPERRIHVEGFTDSTGDAGHNQELSERRALAVRQVLVDRDIEKNRIDVKGYGEEFPVATNETPAGRRMNRRVEIIISDEAGLIPERTN